MLHVEAEGTGSPVVLVHGFTQTLRSWDPVASDLVTYRKVVLPDLPGHGASSDVRVSGVSEAAALLGDACGAGVYVGYSMGGRVCLRLAVDRPELVRALVLVSSSPGIRDDAERDARRKADEELAASIDGGSVEEFVDRWLAQDLFKNMRNPMREDRLRNTPAGLAHAAVVLGQGSTEPMWDDLATLQMPVALIVGENDAKYRGIASEMRRTLPGEPRLSVVPDAGHAPHLESPEMTAGFIESFLARHFSVTS